MVDFPARHVWLLERINGIAMGSINFLSGFWTTHQARSGIKRQCFAAKIMIMHWMRSRILRVLTNENLRKFDWADDLFDFFAPNRDICTNQLELKCFKVSIKDGSCQMCWDPDPRHGIWKNLPHLYRYSNVAGFRLEVADLHGFIMMYHDVSTYCERKMFEMNFKKTENGNPIVTTKQWRDSLLSVPTLRVKNPKSAMTLELWYFRDVKLGCEVIWSSHVPFPGFGILFHQRDRKNDIALSENMVPRSIWRMFEFSTCSTWKWFYNVVDPKKIGKGSNHHLFWKRFYFSALSMKEIITMKWGKPNAINHPIYQPWWERTWSPSSALRSVHRKCLLAVSRPRYVARDQ